MLEKPIAASLIRRLLAIFYDVLLLLGVLFIVSACAVAINRGEAVTHPAYYLSLILTTFVFFGWFWTHGGQTLGMRTWKIKIISDQAGNLTWKQSAIRFLAAALSLLPAGIGLFSLLFDSERLTWYDKLSSTRLISLKHKKSSNMETKT